MKISNVQYDQHGTYNQLSAKIGKQTFWYRFPSAFAADPQDATCFACVALAPAMLLGEDLEVDDSYSVSSRFLEQAEEIQEIYHCWNPIFKRIKVMANARPLEPKGNECGSFFSGGVDATYTMLKHISEIEYLILINGFDFRAPTEIWREKVQQNRRFAEKFGKQLVPVETNYYDFTRECGLTLYATHGSCLASIAYVLGLHKVFISGSDTYREIAAGGTHPLLDPLWSSEKTCLVHTGLEADRAAKLRTIAQNPDAVSNLWVCWRTPAYNCGYCSKCERTFVALRLNDIEGGIFKKKVRIADFARTSIDNSRSLSYYKEFLRLAEEKGDVQIARIVRRIIGRYKLKCWISDMDRYFCSGIMKRVALRLRKAMDKWRGRRREPMYITLTPQQPDDAERLRLVQAKFADDHYKPLASDIGSVFFEPQAPST